MQGASQYSSSQEAAGEPESQDPGLVRGIGFWGVLSTNVLNMVGVGPFLTIPLALAAMGGPQAMLGWILGALLALCDGLVWAELGSRFPNSGGPYHYLLQGFGPKTYGRLIAYLFLFQSLLAGPISIASGAVGFAEYARVFHPLTPLQLKGMAMLLCLLNLAVLYRSIRSVGALSIVVAAAVLLTCGWIILSGALHFHLRLLLDLPPGAFHLTRGFWMGLGASTLIATYDYGGYNNACLLGGEVQQPRRTIPRAVIVSILLVAVLYLAMNTAILGVLPWRQGMASGAIVADFMRALYGNGAARLVSGLVVIASWGSAFAILLGYSRIPYAAAKDGTFPAIFGRVHPTEHFPTVALLYMGVGSALMCLFSLGSLISALMVVQTVTQFMAQCVAVMLLRKRQPRPPGVFLMPLYPVPALVALIGWLYIVATSGFRYILLAAVLVAVGAGIFLLRARKESLWPFQPA